MSASTSEAAPGARHRGGLSASLLPAATAATLLLPFALFYSRALADLLLSAVAALFLLRSWATADATPFRTGWFRIALALWIWLVAASIQAGSLPATGQAIVVIRLLVFALALEHWVLAPAPARHWLFRVYATLAAWMILECWQQYLFGTNIAGYPRWGDGALTGPFATPRAGSAWVALFFPALMPPIMAGLTRPTFGARAGAIALLVLGVATMLLIGQRMPALLMILGLVAAGLLLRPFRLPVIVAMLAGGLVLAATPIISPPTFQKLVLHFAEQMRHFPTSNYGQLYTRALVMLEARPWLGFGADGFRHFCSDPHYFHGIPWLGVDDSDQGDLLGCNQHPHNFYLELATDGGLPGLILFIALVVAWFRRLATPLATGAALPGAPLSVALFVAALVLLWPLASTTALFVIPTAGWVFLTLGWGLAGQRVSTIGMSAHFSNKS